MNKNTIFNQGELNNSLEKWMLLNVAKRISTIIPAHKIAVKSTSILNTVLESKDIKGLRVYLFVVC